MGLGMRYARANILTSANKISSSFLLDDLSFENGENRDRYGVLWSQKNRR